MSILWYKYIWNVVFAHLSFRSLRTMYKGMSKTALKNHTCWITKIDYPTEDMLRFSCSPDGDVILDFSEKLPGKGVWVSKEINVVDQFLKQSKEDLGVAFGRADISSVITVADIEIAVRKKMLSLMGLAKKSSRGVFGEAELKKSKKPIKLLFVASDVGTNSLKYAEKLGQKKCIIIDVFSKNELEGASGVPHCALVGVTTLDFFKETLHKYGDFITKIKKVQV